MSDWPYTERAIMETLVAVDNELHEDDVKSLIFLSEPSVPKKFGSKFKTGLELFGALDKSIKLSQRICVLVDLLKVIGRVDLAEKLKNELNVHCNDFCGVTHVCPFRTLLFQLSEELGADELNSLRYLYEKLPKKAVIEMGIDLFSIMLQHTTLSPQNLTKLEAMLHAIRRMDLLDKIIDYKNSSGNYGYRSRPSSPQGDSLMDEQDDSFVGPGVLESSTSNQQTQDDLQKPIDPVDITMITPKLSSSTEDRPGELMCSENQFSYEQHVIAQVASTPGDEPHVIAQVASTPSLEGGLTIRHQHAPSHVPSLNNHNFYVAPTASRLPSHLPSLNNHDFYEAPEAYKMNADPRGICLIIDNQHFQCNPDDEEAAQLGNRAGSEKDLEALHKTFEKLKFIVDIKTDLTDFEIIANIRDVTSVNHSRYDCFVCCILSHGGEGFVFGTNGRKVLITDITGHFRAQSCPTLSGKPKLFFLQCCRGKSHQQAHPPPPPLKPRMFETDAPEPEVVFEDFIPSEADFLFGYATVADAVSYRSRSSGTFYISELTKAFDNYAHREDLLTLLTRVNNEVSRRVYSETRDGEHIVYKQIPAPQYTLRKVLKFK